MRKSNSTPNIIFDFGGVLLNIDQKRTIRAFKAIGLKDVGLIEQEYRQGGLLDRFEKGAISPDGFRSGLRKYLNEGVSDKQIDDAWNSMLLDLTFERLELLEKLKRRHRIFLLSNSNVIHWESYTKKIHSDHGVHLSDCFEKDYYSHNMGLRKPDPRIYAMILESEGLAASETLFIDDILANVEAARSAGMKTHHLDLQKGESILNLFVNCQG